MDGVRDFALLTLNRLLDEAWDWGTIAQPRDCLSERCGDEAATAQRSVPGTLDDYAFTVHAGIDAWIASGHMNFYRVAVKLADAMIARFYDKLRAHSSMRRRSKDGAIQLGALGGASQAAAGFADARREIRLLLRRCCGWKRSAGGGSIAR